MTLHYCIFCYNDFDTHTSTNYIDTLSFNVGRGTNFIKSIKNDIDNVKNTKIILSCNHPYHLGCFVTYHAYKCSSKYKQKCFSYKNILLDSCKLTCPLCTIQIKSSDVYFISKKIYKLQHILTTLNKKINILFLQIKTLYISLFLKKIIISLKIKDIHKFNRTCILYDDLLQVKKELSCYINFCRV